MNDNVAKLIFGIEEGKDQFYDQVGIFLTPKTLKLLSIMTTLAVQSAEQIGGEIHLDEEKVRKLYESFKAQQP
jgi:hypothetical protein